MHTRALTLGWAANTVWRDLGEGWLGVRSTFLLLTSSVARNSPATGTEVVCGHWAKKPHSRVRGRLFVPHPHLQPRVLQEWIQGSVLMLFPSPGGASGCHFLSLSQVSTCSGEPSAFLPSHLLEGKGSDCTCFHSVLAPGLEGRGENLLYWVVPLRRHETWKE